MHPILKHIMKKLEVIHCVEPNPGHLSQLHKRKEKILKWKAKWKRFGNISEDKVHEPIFTPQGRLQDCSFPKTRIL